VATVISNPRLRVGLAGPWRTTRIRTAVVTLSNATRMEAAVRPWAVNQSGHILFAAARNERRNGLLTACRCQPESMAGAGALGNWMRSSFASLPQPAWSIVSSVPGT